MSAWLEHAALWCWQNSLAAAALAAGVLGLRSMWRGRIAPGWLCLAGWLVMLRLFLPAAFSYQWAWDRAWVTEDKAAAPAPPPVSRPVENDTPFPVREVAAVFVNPEPLPASLAPAVPATVETSAPVEPPAVVAVPVSVPSSPADPGVAASPPVNWFHLAAWVWMAGSALFLSVVILRHARFVRSLRGAAGVDCSDPVRHAARLTGLRRVPALLTIPGGGSPFLCGVFRPRIVFPADTLAALSPAEFHHVLLHEMLHIARRDLLANWLLAVVRALHWWNPLIHLTARRLLADRELLRDQQAVTLLRDPAERAAYGHTLLKLALPLPAPAPSPGLTPFFRTEKELHRRLTMLQSPLRRPRLAATAAALTLTAIAVPVFSTARGQEEKKPDEAAPPPTGNAALLPVPAITDTAGNPQLDALTKQWESLKALKGEQLIAAQLELGVQDGVLQKLYPEYAQEVAQLHELIKEGADPSDPKCRALEDSTKDKLQLLELFALKHVDKMGERIAELKAHPPPPAPAAKAPDINHLIGQWTVLKDLQGEKLLMAVYALNVDSTLIQKLFPELQHERIHLEIFTGSGFGPRHPKAIGLRESVNTKQKQLEQAARQYVEGLAIRIAAAKAAPGHPGSAVPSSPATTTSPTAELQQLRAEMAEMKAALAALRKETGGGKKVEAAPRAEAPKQTDKDGDDLPRGTAEPNRPGLVRSPFAPDKGLVDVTDLASGTAVKCPYTGKLFRVP